MTVSDDLNATADEIERRGWTQEEYLNRETGQVCLVGGMEHMLSIYQDQGDNLEDIVARWERSAKMRDAIKEFLDITDCLETWNDDYAESQEEVVQMLRDAAIKNQPDAM